MRRLERFAQLSAPRQALVRLCQTIDYGQILDIFVLDREPLFSPEPVVIVEVKLDGDPRPRVESELADFVLCNAVWRLMDRIDEIGTGRSEKILVMAGLPKRVSIRATLREVVR